jgi:hypothetical protein
MDSDLMLRKAIVFNFQALLVKGTRLQRIKLQLPNVLP